METKLVFHALFEFMESDGLQKHAFDGFQKGVNK